MSTFVCFCSLIVEDYFFPRSANSAFVLTVQRSCYSAQVWNGAGASPTYSKIGDPSQRVLLHQCVVWRARGKDKYRAVSRMEQPGLSDTMRGCVAVADRRRPTTRDYLSRTRRARTSCADFR
jgi:hypothetical protein